MLQKSHLNFISIKIKEGDYFKRKYTPLKLQSWFFSGSCWGEEEKGDASLLRAHWEPTREYRDGSTHPFQVSSPGWEDGTGRNGMGLDGMGWDGMGWDGEGMGWLYNCTSYNLSYKHFIITGDTRTRLLETWTQFSPRILISLTWFFR